MSDESRDNGRWSSNVIEDGLDRNAAGGDFDKESRGRGFAPGIGFRGDTVHSGGKLRKPVIFAGKASFVIGCRHWQRQVEDIGLLMIFYIGIEAAQGGLDQNSSRKTMLTQALCSPGR